MQTQRIDAKERQLVARSYLFVPADSERKLAKAASSDADALILDLEDSVRPEERLRARNLAREFLTGHPEKALWVRINPLNQPDALSDLRATVNAAPRGIVLPKPVGASDANRLGKLLDVLEQENELDSGSIRIMPITTELPAAMFRLQEYAGATRRIEALTWGAEDLSSALGASANRDPQGRWLAPYDLARSLCLFAAAAAGVPAIDTVFTDFRNVEGLQRSAAAARRDGFGGMLAIHPDQVEIINAAFIPDAAEVERAHKIVDLFAANLAAGALQLDGEMLDMPHLVQAKKILAMTGAGDKEKEQQ
jgi:citrate lyase subunit beta/citryl-CoA lyase